MGQPEKRDKQTAGDGSKRAGAAYPDASLRVLLLAELSRGPGYGYGLARAIEQRRGGGLTAAPGVLYPVLHKLELDGLARGAWEQGENGRPRRTYTITPKGRRLAEKLAAVQECGAARGEAATAKPDGLKPCLGGEVRP